MKIRMGKEVLVLVVILWMFYSCKKEHLFDCLTSTGKEITQFRQSRTFTNIELKDNVDLVIRPNTNLYIKVTAGEHLIDGIITELNGSTLYIRNENKCNWVRSFNNTYTVEIGIDSLTKISYYGSGSVSCLDTIRKQDFYFDSWNGSGDISILLHSNTSNLVNNTGRINMKVSGWSGISYVYFNDSGVFDGSALETNYTYIRNSSTGDCRINAFVEIGAEIQYAGDIYYRGNPVSLHSTITGTGKLIPE